MPAWGHRRDDALAAAAREAGQRVRLIFCPVCAGVGRLAIVGDPSRFSTPDVSEVLMIAALLDRGLPALPESGGWYDQVPQLREALIYTMAERNAVRDEQKIVQVGDELIKVR